MNRPLEILKTLADHQVEFLVVGGVAAVALGVPIATWDLDVIHNCAPENVKRLLVALEALEVRYWHRPGLRPDESHLSGPGHQLLATRLGRLDVLGAIGNGHTYADLVPRSVEVELAAGFRCRVLDLETQIAIKEEIGAEKDLAVLPILRRTLAEKQRK